MDSVEMTERTELGDYSSVGGLCVCEMWELGGPSEGLESLGR